MRRPTIRTVFRALGLTLGMLVLLALAASLALRVYGQRRLAKARSALSQQGVSLDLASYEPPKVPKEENAAAWFQAGAAAIVLSQEDRGFMVASSYRPAREWSDERAQRVRAILAANQGAILNLHRGAVLSRSSFDLAYRVGFWEQLPELGALRNAAALVAVEGRLALRDGDEEAVVVAERALSGMAGALTREPILIMQIVGEAEEARALSLAAEMVTEPGDLRALARLTGVLPPGERLRDLRQSFACEAAMMSTMFDPGNMLDDTLLPDAARHTLSLLNASGYTRLTHATLLEALLFQRSLVDAPLQTLLVDDPPPPTSPFLMHRWLVHSLTPAARKTSLAVRLNLAGRQLVGAGIVIRTAGLRERAYPATAPQEAEVGRPNALTGVPLRYTLDSSGSARLEIPGVTPAELGGPHSNPLLALDLPAPAQAKPRPTDR